MAKTPAINTSPLIFLTKGGFLECKEMANVINVETRTREIIVKTRRGLEEIYGEQLDQVILFGSQARGDAQPDSDIDILALLNKGMNSQICRF